MCTASTEQVKATSYNFITAVSHNNMSISYILTAYNERAKISHVLIECFPLYPAISLAVLAMTRAFLLTLGIPRFTSIYFLTVLCHDVMVQNVEVFIVQSSISYHCIHLTICIYNASNYSLYMWLGMFALNFVILLYGKAV